MSRPIRTLLFSTLYPSVARPTHGVFVETRLRELLKTGKVETRVVAPVPWFPSRAERFGDWARMAATPAYEERDGVKIWHPRYLLPPKVGMTVAPLTLALGARATVSRLLREGFDFDLIDAHYYYPDGVAAAMLAGWFKKPFVITARGTDLNLIPCYPLPRRMIQWAAAQAAGSIGVCSALLDVLREMGADDSRLHVMRNGVDLQRFSPRSQSECRARLGLPIQGRLLVSVGHLVERKGHHLVIEALDHLPDASLVIVGDGEERARLHEAAALPGRQGRVLFAGAQPNTALSEWYSAADALVLASSREGWANVLLESMACGTPVVATRIWGTPEVVAAPEAGELVDRRDAQSIAQAVQRLFERSPDRAAVRRYAENFGWEPTSQAQVDLFSRISGAAA
ncbi:glycosyltransferase family 4 protein [Niveibacterium microcysteis]|uniref:Glycosyltransferase family 4 protein n=1 Tax=Niveibacterium microcysteis TaxID=2811415 RepID=A0ABX7MCD5_9RHOO|nr:glycosyltransferase family 4 protein [Niveibacterium microcysteis]QSI78145.1 glycosyltransferase family 4 protein [Niveibacterium microcysteis]